MRDVTLLVLVAGLTAAALFRPWLGVLGLSALSYLHPQGWGGAVTWNLPIYATLFLATLLGALYAAWRRPEDLRWPPLDWRLILLGALWATFVLTTLSARAYFSAWDKLIEVSKMFAALALSLVLINSRKKLLFLLAAIALSIALSAVKGGYWAVMSGFADRVMGPPRSALYDNNQFAIAAIMTIPLLVLWRRLSPSRALGWVLTAAAAFCVLAALSSWSRGALLSLSGTLVLLALASRRKWLSLPAIAALLFFALGNLPESWLGRMETIATFQEDDSAQTRLTLWRMGIDQALEHPVLGNGFAAWRLSTFGYRLDWHSAYIQLLAEHGFVGFVLWSGLIFGNILAPLYAATGTRERPESAAHREWGTMLAVSLVGYAIGAAFLSLAYWEYPYQLIVIGALGNRLADRQAARKPDDSASTGERSQSLAAGP